MNITIGKRIRELRQRDDRTQTDLADALGVSSQAVSRWEIGVTYPDMELIPSIANYFGVTIDELFGYAGEREERINAIISEANELGKYYRGVDVNIEKNLTLLRNGLVEFPKNERLMFTLAQTLSNAGYVRHGQSSYYNDDGYLVDDVKRHAENEYWNEAVKLYEVLLSETKDPNIINDSAYDLAILYSNLGQHEKGLALAERMPTIWYSREMLKPYATDGEEGRRYFAYALLRSMNAFSLTVCQLLMSSRQNFDTDLPIRMLNGTIALYDMLFEDGNMGPYHAEYADLKLYLSEHLWRNGQHDEAFAALDCALEHAKTLDAVKASDDPDPKYTTPLLKGISMEKAQWGLAGFAKGLPDKWPVYMKPDFDGVAKEMQSDPRWADWVRRTQEN